MSIDVTKLKNLNKNFEEFKLIGEGGFGSVFSAVYKKTGKRYAVKVLECNDITRKTANQMRFANEIKLIKQVSSPYVVRLFGSYISDKESYMAMELVEGPSLKEQLKKKKKFIVDEAISIAKEICQGLADIHKQKIVHRDLKPNNILFDKKNTVKLIDFGISLNEESKRVTQDNKLVGSVQYVAPELVMKSHNPSVQSDIYSLGIIMYEMLSGHVPFNAGDHQSIALQHVHNQLPPLEGVNDTIPQAVENIIIKCTAKNVEDRYVDCQELANDLKTCLQQKRITETRLVIDPKKKNKKSFTDKVNSKKFTISLIIVFSVLILLAIILMILALRGII